MIGLTDRIRLRPLTAATRGSCLYLSSEESAIRLIAPELDEIWTPLGGQQIIGRLISEGAPEQGRPEATSPAGAVR
jgi:glutamate synthase domain-containing protein 1